MNTAGPPPLRHLPPPSPRILLPQPSLFLPRFFFPSLLPHPPLSFPRSTFARNRPKPRRAVACLPGVALRSRIDVQARGRGALQLGRTEGG